MSSDDIDAFRAELLRQKIIFEAELRRQRDMFEERLAAVSQDLADREADCRNLQAVVTILGKKVDTLLDRKNTATPRRGSSPSRVGGTYPPARLDDRLSDAGTTASVGSSTLVRGTRSIPSPYRRNSPLRPPVANGGAAKTLHPSSNRAPSLNAVGSRNTSPSRASVASGSSHRPRIVNYGASAADKRGVEGAEHGVGGAYGSFANRNAGDGNQMDIPTSVRLVPPRASSGPRTAAHGPAHATPSTGASGKSDGYTTWLVN